MHVTLFHHPDAGGNAWSGERILAALKRKGFEASYVELGGDDIGEALAETRNLAVVAGGDGSVSWIATSLPDRKIPIAILPTGSGNNIARALGVFGELGRIIDALPDAKPDARLRICSAEGNWGTRRFVEAVGLGAVTNAIKELQHDKLDGADKRRQGRQRVMSNIEAAGPVDALVTVDGSVLEGRHLFVEIMNLPMIGANLALAPRIATDDRLLTVVYLPEEDREAAIDWLRQGAEGPGPFRRVRGAAIGLTGAPQPLRLEDKAIDWDGRAASLLVDEKAVRVMRPEMEI